MGKLEDVLEDLMSEIGFEVTTLEYLIGHSEVSQIVNEEEAGVNNVEQLKGRRDMALMVMKMIEERME